MRKNSLAAGFYGCPWTTHQRKSLFERMQEFHLDTYLYAPKDDCKHRMYWRDLYSVEEAGMFFYSQFRRSLFHWNNSSMYLMNVNEIFNEQV